MSEEAPHIENEFDYAFVNNKARIAIYDDMLSEPRIIEIDPAPTTDFIGALSAKIYEHAKQMGGTIAFSIIQQVTENFIHARFSEIVVSIFNEGKTIRFSDQGPGIKNKERALLPGFSSATADMKQYIKGVGSGLPTVKEWLSISGRGTITIEDNLTGGAVVTISVEPQSQDTFHEKNENSRIGITVPSLSEKEKQYLKILLSEGATRVTDFIQYTGDGNSACFNTLKHLEEFGLVRVNDNKRRELTSEGTRIARQLQ